VVRDGGVQHVRCGAQRGSELCVVRRLRRGAQRAGRVLRRSLFGVDAAAGAGGCKLGGGARCAAAAAARLLQPLPDALGGYQRLKYIGLVSSHAQTAPGAGRCQPHPRQQAEAGPPHPRVAKA
jgi:hypothetical protein